MESRIFLLVFAIMVSNSDGRSLQKRAAFYIANETACVVDNTVYYNGDPIPTDDPCEACKCRPPGFACVLKDCEVKPGCRAVRRAGHCCPDYVCGCEHNGRMYRDGDEIRDSQNPCYTCHCQGSAIACAFVDCFFRVDCAPRYVNGECCPRYDHCTSTDPTANASFPTEPILADKISTTSIADKVEDEKSLTTTLAPNEGAYTRVSSVEPPNEVKIFSESSVEYADTFGPTVTDPSVTTAKRTEIPDVVTLVYAKDKLPGGESESGEALRDTVSDGSAEQTDSFSPPTVDPSDTTGEKTETEKDRSPDELASPDTEKENISELRTEPETHPREPAGTTTKLGESNGKEEDLTGELVKTKSSPESSTAEVNEVKNDQEVSDTELENLKDSTPAPKQSEDGYKTSSHVETTTLQPPIPLVYLHYSKGDSSKKSQSSTGNDLNEENQRDGVEPDENDSLANEISFTTQSPENENLLPHKGALESDRKPKEKVDDDHETTVTEDTTQKSEETEYKGNAEKNETKQDRGLKTTNKGTNDTEIQQVQQQKPGVSPSQEIQQQQPGVSSTQQVQQQQPGVSSTQQVQQLQPDDSAQQIQQQQPDISSTVLDLQQLSTPSPVQEVSKEKAEENKQQEVLKQGRAGENKQSVKTVSKSQNDNEAQKIEKQDEISISTEASVQEQQIPSAEVPKSQETVNEQEQQEVQNAEQIIHKSDYTDKSDESGQNQAKEDRSVKTASSSPSEKEPQKIQHQYEITPPSAETTLDQAGQSLSVPQEEDETADGIKQEIPIEEEEANQEEYKQDDSERDLDIKTVSSTISSSSETTTQQPKQETVSPISTAPTTLGENDQIVISTHDENPSDSVGKVKQGTVNRKGVIHEGEKDEGIGNTEEETSKQDRSVKTANKVQAQKTVQNDGIASSSTENTLQEQQLSNPSQNSESEQESNEGQNFPTWEEISHKHQENDQIGDHYSRQGKGIKTGSASGSDEDGQNSELQGEITFPPSETTVNGYESTVPAFQNTESQDTVNIGKLETVNRKGIPQNTKNYESENDAGRDDSKQDRSVKTASQKQEPSPQRDDVTTLPTEIIVGQTQSSILLSQKTKSTETVTVQTEDSKQDRIVKTSSTRKPEAQEEAQRSNFSPSEESQQFTSPSSIKTKIKVRNSERPSFPSWEKIHHKSGGHDQISAIIHHESRQDRSIKTGISSVSDAVTPDNAQQEESTPSLQETTLPDDPSTTVPQTTTKSTGDEAKKEDGGKKGIIYNSEGYGIKGGISQEESEENRSVETASKDETKTETREPEHLDDVTQSTTETTTSPEQQLKPGKDSSKKDRSIKTASKDTSRTETLQTVQQDEIRSTSTERILDEQQQQLTTPRSQKVKPNEKNQEEQKFPTWEEINYKHDGGNDHTRQSRSIKTGSSSSSDREAQNAEPDITTLPSTLEDNKETTEVQYVKSEDNDDEEKAETASKKGFYQKSEQYDNVGADESKQDRSIKTAAKGTSQTEEQETVRQDGVTPSSTATSLSEEQVLNPQSHTSDERKSEQPRFPTWEEISHKHETNSHISRQDRSAKTANKTPSETEPQEEEPLDEAIPEGPSGYDETSTLAPQNTKSKDSFEKQSQEIANEKEAVHEPEERENKGSFENKDPKQERSVKTKGTTKKGEQETVKQDEITITSTNRPSEEQHFSDLQSQTPKEKNSEQPKFPTWEEINHRYERKSQKTATTQDQNVKTTNNGLSGGETQSSEQQTVTCSETTLGDTTTEATPAPQNTKNEAGIGEKEQQTEQRRKTVNKGVQSENQSTVDQEKPKEDRSVKTASKSTSQQEKQGAPDVDDIGTSPTQAILSDEEIRTPAPASQRISSQGNEQEEQVFPDSEEISHTSEGSENAGSDFEQDIGIETDSQTKTDAQRKKEQQQEDITLPSQETTPDYYEPSTAASQKAEILGSLEEENQRPASDQEPIRESQNQEGEDKVRPVVSRKGRSIKTSIKTVSQADSRDALQNDERRPDQSTSETEQQTTPEQSPKPEESGEQEFPRWEDIIHKSEESFPGSVVGQNGSKQSRGVKTGTNQATASGAQTPEQQQIATSPPQEITLTEQFTSVSQNEAQQQEEQNSEAVHSEEVVLQEQYPSSPTPQTTLPSDQSSNQQEQQTLSKKVVSGVSSNSGEQADNQDVKKSDSIKHRSIKTSGSSPAPEIQTSDQYNDAVQSTATTLEGQQSPLPPLQDVDVLSKKQNKDTDVYNPLKTSTLSVSDEDANQNQNKGFTASTGTTSPTATSTAPADVNEGETDPNTKSQTVKKENPASETSTNQET